MLLVGIATYCNRSEVRFLPGSPPQFLSGPRDDESHPGQVRYGMLISPRIWTHPNFQRRGEKHTTDGGHDEIRRHIAFFLPIAIYFSPFASFRSSALAFSTAAILRGSACRIWRLACQIRSRALRIDALQMLDCGAIDAAS
jgi:hypothetical protein